MVFGSKSLCRVLILAPRFLFALHDGAQSSAFAA
jgi:hypothetical protein